MIVINVPVCVAYFYWCVLLCLVLVCYGYVDAHAQPEELSKGKTSEGNE